MSEIENLLKADSDNIVNCYKLFDNFSNKLNETFEDAAQLYITIMRIVSDQFKDDFEQSILNEIEGKNTDEKELAVNRIWSRRARGTLLLLSYRSYMWAATDLYRTRITSSMNHLRQQIESSFYLNLILEQPHVGREWFNVNDDKEGKLFFRKYSTNFGEFLDKNKFSETYNRISGTSSHTRFSSAMYGLNIDSTNESQRYKDIYIMKMQEFDQNNPGQFILNVVAFLADQIKVFRTLISAIPEIDDPILLETRLPMYGDKIGFLFNQFNKQFPQSVTFMPIDVPPDH